MMPFSTAATLPLRRLTKEEEDRICEFIRTNPQATLSRTVNKFEKEFDVRVTRQCITSLIFRVSKENQQNSK